jgi:AcrR family transcriptional regulator
VVSKALDHRIRVAALRREQMQLHLLFAGLQLASTTSIHEIEVEDVVRQAEVSRGSFYNYFPSVPALYEGLARQLMQELAAMLDVLAPPSLDVVTRLASSMRMSMRLFVDFPMLGRFLTQVQWPSQRSDLELFANIVRDVHLGIEAGQFTRMQAPIGVNIAMGSLIGGVHAMLLERPAAGYEDKVTHQVLIGLGVDSGSASKVSQMPLSAQPVLPATGLFGKLSEMVALEKNADSVDPTVSTKSSSKIRLPSRHPAS